MPKRSDLDNLSKEQLVEEINNLRKRKKYGLVWDVKDEDVVQQCKEKLPIPKEIISKHIITDKNRPTHLLIEGDNYHALSVLNYTHNKKIDFIYIDPPYNIGKGTWKYNNNIVDKNDAFKHSKWVSSMYKRLNLAKNLLKEEGIICVTIDNYEIHNLRHLMEEIFGNRDIIIIVIEHNHRGRAKSNFALTHEYAIWGVPKNKDLITRLREKSKDISRNLRRTGTDSRRYESASMFYGIEVDNKSLNIISTTEALPKDEKFIKSKHAKASKNRMIIFPIDGNGVERRWYYGRDKVMEEVKEGTVWAKRIKGKIQIHYWQEGKEARRKSVWIGPKYDSSTHGSELLTSIIGENDFPFPKSIYAVMECIESATANKNAVILDFFAGSGTTGHAVLELNKKDKGNRQFILCTNNENNICNEITYPRIKNVIKGYKYTGTKKVELFDEKLTIDKIKKSEKLMKIVEDIELKQANNYDEFEKLINNDHIQLLGINNIKNKVQGLKENLMYFKTGFISSDQTDQCRYHLTVKATTILCMKENTFEMVVSKDEYKLFKNETHYTGIIFNPLNIDKFKSYIKNIKGRFNVYIFSLSDDSFDEEFNDIKDKVSISSIPESILRVYRRIFG